MFLKCCFSNNSKKKEVILNNSILNNQDQGDQTQSRVEISDPIQTTSKYETEAYLTFKKKLVQTESDIKVNLGTEISFKQLALVHPPTPKTSSKLLLKGELFQDKELIIDSRGLKNSLRDKKDGQTFFGISTQKDYKGVYYNDYILSFPSSINTYNPNYTGRVFDIVYSKKTNDYQLYMINNSMYLYYIIEQSFYFEKEKEYMLLLGKVFITISQKEGNNTKEKFIIIRVEYENNNECDEYTFSENDVPITIGRVKSDICLPSSSISKKHAVIDFSKDLKKFFFRDNQSTNGSIFILKEDDTLKLRGDMKFKLNDLMFHIMELP